MRFAILVLAMLLFLPVQAGTEEGLAALKDRRFNEAFSELKGPAAAGNAEAQNGLGILYINGHGVDKDFDKAFKWFELAARSGLSNAQFQVGIAYLNGIGVEQNYIQSLAWFLVAQNHGSEVANEGVGACKSAMKSRQIDRADKLAATLMAELASQKD